MPVVGAAIEDADDAGVLESGDDIGFAFETADQFGIGGDFVVEQFERDTARQSWVTGEIDRPHSAPAQDSFDPVSGESRTHPQHCCYLHHVERRDGTAFSGHGPRWAGRHAPIGGDGVSRPVLRITGLPVL